MPRVSLSNELVVDTKNRIRPGTRVLVTDRGGTAVPVYTAASGTAVVSAGGTIYADADDAQLPGWIEEGSYVYTPDNGDPVYGEAVAGASAGGREIGYAQITADYGGTSLATAEADVPGLAVTVTIANTRPIVVEFFGQIQKQTNTGSFVAYIKEGATYLTAASHATMAINEIRPSFCKVRLTPSLGAHTYKIAVTLSSIGGRVNSAATLPAFIQVREV